MEQNNSFINAMMNDKEGFNASVGANREPDSGNEYGVNPNAEKFVGGLAKVLLIIGIAGCVMLFIVSLVLFGDRSTQHLGWITLGSGMGLLLTGIMQWAFLRVIVNISHNLFNINSALRGREKRGL